MTFITMEADNVRLLLQNNNFRHFISPFYVLFSLENSLH